MENQCVWRHCVVLKAQSSNHTWAVCESAPFKHSGVTNYSEYSAMDRYCAACSSANSSVWPTGASPLWNCSIHTRLSFEDKIHRRVELILNGKKAEATSWQLSEMEQDLWIRAKFRTGSQHGLWNVRQTSQGSWDHSVVYLKMDVCSLSVSFKPHRSDFGINL